MSESHKNDKGILFVDGKASGRYVGKKYHAVGITQLFSDSYLQHPIEGSYLNNAEVCPFYVFSSGAALVEYQSSQKYWKCGYVVYNEKLNNIW